MAPSTAVRTVVARVARRLGEAGASLVEYTLLVALIAAVAIGAIGFLGSEAESTMCSTGNSIANADGTPPASVPC